MVFQFDLRLHLTGRTPIECLFESRTELLDIVSCFSELVWDVSLDATMAVG